MAYLGAVWSIQWGNPYSDPPEGLPRVRAEVFYPSGHEYERKCPPLLAAMTTPHQSLLHPSMNKFHTGNGSDKKHYWLTPPDLYAKMDAEFHFDFDPCPYPKPDGFDGLTCEWGNSNYVNPPFGSIMHNGRKKGPTAWMRKAIEEQRKGRLSVVVYPVDKWVLMMIEACGASEIRNLGDVKWCAIEDGCPGKGTGRHVAAFILRP